MTFRIFTNDIGPERYSALMPVRAETPLQAKAKARRVASKLGCKAVALPESRRELWPDGRTGLLPEGARRFVVSC